MKGTLRNGTLALALTWVAIGCGSQGASSVPTAFAPVSEAGQRAAARAAAKVAAAASEATRRAAFRQIVGGIGAGGRAPYAYVLVLPGEKVVLRDGPGGSRLARLGSRTQFGSPRVLAIVHAGRGWLGVIDPVLANNQVAWVHFDPTKMHAYFTDYSLQVDLLRRAITLFRRDRGVFTFPVAIGKPGAETPAGRFAITDKLIVQDRSGVYGCCAIALSGHQQSLPPGWLGGDRIAIHGTPATYSIGQAASNGCLRATNAAVSAVIDRVPLGTPVFVAG